MREQNLRRDSMVRRERFIPGAAQAHLPHRRRGLQFVYRVWPAQHTQPRTAFGDCARGHQHDLLTRFHKPGDLSRALGNKLSINANAISGDQCAANFYDPAIKHAARPSREIAPWIDG